MSTPMTCCVCIYHVIVCVTACAMELVSRQRLDRAAFLKEGASPCVPLQLHSGTPYTTSLKHGWRKAPWTRSCNSHCSTVIWCATRTIMLINVTSTVSDISDWSAGHQYWAIKLKTGQICSWSIGASLRFADAFIQKNLQVTFTTTMSNFGLEFFA